MAIPYTVFIHPKDRAALERLKAIPVLDEVLRQYMHYIGEQTLSTYMRASALEISPRQLPRVHSALVEVSEALAIDPPALFLWEFPLSNAYAMGDKKPIIVLFSSLVESLQEDELRAVLAHECGHIACRHMLYRTLAYLLLNGSEKFLPNIAQLATVPLLMALYYWVRMSELSADRAAACALGSVEPVQRSLLRLSAGPKSITDQVDMAVYLEQAADVEDDMNSLWKQYLLFGYRTWSTHPFAAVRVRELERWKDTEEFKAILRGDLTTTDVHTDVRSLFGS